MSEKDVTAEDLFPLPLTSMEKFHWFDSTPEFPNLTFCRLRLDGVVNPAVAEQAIENVIARHPLLRSKIANQDGGLAWELVERKKGGFVWDGNLGRQTGPVQPPQNGLKWNVSARTDGKETEVWFETSHVVGDGLAGIQVASEWMRFYHQIACGDSKPKKMHRLADSDLKNRNRLGLMERAYLKNLWRQPLGLFGATKFIFRRPAEAVRIPEIVSDWNRENQPAVEGTWLDNETTAALKQKSAEYDVSMNSIFVGVLMKTLECLCLENRERRSKWVRIILPMNIRTFADRRMSATNRATVVQIDRQRSDFDREHYIQSIDREIKIIRAWELGKLFLIAVRGMAAIPGLLKRSARSKKCRGTAVFANLGEPFARIGLPVVDNQLQVGELRLMDFDLFGPIRHRMPINFTTQRHIGRIKLTLHFDPRVLSQGQSEDILNRFKNDLVELANG